ncbi:MAG: Chorismate synthase [Bacteroidetes bacterium MED-G17]|nr:MAG: Chorismate synthase [Bacteroidetes bacterium MED-G17]
MSGNTFGKLFRLTTFGESHGIALGAIVDGCPPNILLSENDIQIELDKRKPGQSKFVTQRKEDDQIQILSGIFEGKTTGTPIGLIVKNKDQKSKDYSNIKDKFRPGHADITYQEKYGIRDYRGGGRSSARETVMRVAGGAIAKKVLKGLGISTQAGVVQIGDIVTDNLNLNDCSKNSFNFADNSKTKTIEKFFQKLTKDQDSIGAKILIQVRGLPSGVGSPVFSKLDAEIAKAVMSVNAVKAVEVGEGVKVAFMRGSQNRDLINIYASLKPTSSISQPTKTLNSSNKEVELAIKGRHDPCVGIRAVAILEAMVSICLLDQILIDKGQCFNVERKP